MNDLQLAKKIENKYQEEFIILSQNSGWFSPKVQFEAAPKDRPEIIFSGEFIKKQDRISDYYRIQKIGQLADDWLHTQLKFNNTKMVCKGEVSCKDKEGKIPDFQTILNQEAEDLDVICRMYFFEQLTDDNKETLLRPILKVCDDLHGKGVDNVVFDIAFFNETEFINDNLSSYSFGFNVTKDGDFEYTEKYNALESKVMFKVPKNGKVPSVDEVMNIKLDKDSNPIFHIFR